LAVPSNFAVVLKGSYFPVKAADLVFDRLIEPFHALASGDHHGNRQIQRVVQALDGCLRIPVMWAGDSGDVGRRRSEATLVAFYSSQVAHMSQE
jgi:hypothetical protein